jgi:predicted  nucleic acid-binding Zn-ribbon protein
MHLKGEGVEKVLKNIDSELRQVETRLSEVGSEITELRNEERHLQEVRNALYAAHEAAKQSAWERPNADSGTTTQ